MFIKNQMKKIFLSLCYLIIVSSFQTLFGQNLSKEDNSLPPDVTVQSLMSEKDVLYFDNKFYIDPLGKLWAVNTNNLMTPVNPLEETSTPVVLKLPTEIKQLRNLVWLSLEKIIVLDKDDLKLIENKTIKKLMTLPYKDMNIEGATDSILYVFGQTYIANKTSKANKKTVSYGLFLYDIGGRWLKLCDFKEKINAVWGDGTLTLVAVGKNIFLFDRVIGARILYSGDEDILSIAVTQSGKLYFSTKNNLFYSNFKKTYKLTNLGASKLWSYGENLYILYLDNTLVQISPAIAKKAELPKLDFKIDNTPENTNVTLLLNKPRNLILSGQISQAIQAYAQLVEKDETNSTLLEEYAYALALGGVYEGALMNLDRAKLLGVLSEKGYFYAGQVFALMGYNRPATEFLTHCSVPQWIYPKCNELYKQYKLASSLPQEKELETAFRRTNYLASVSMYYQSIALYEQILEGKPDAYLFHIGYSIPLEKVGLRKLAAEELQTGISLMGDNPQYAEAKQAFNQRLEQLRQQPENATANEQPNLLKKLDKFNPQTMLYVGGSFSENYTSFNARFGVYLSNSFNGALDLGVLGSSDATTFNIGVSGYQRFGNVLNIGLGLYDAIGSNSNVLSIAPTLGFSFINAKRNSSWDIFFNAQYPVMQGASVVYGFSIGKSFYFGTRK